MLSDLSADSSETVTGSDGTMLTEIDGYIGTNEIGVANSTLATFRDEVNR
ncbi:MAG: hypothetical protein ABSE52_07320 [Candidatus Dormibacteria bacterium]|jgi:hypothetical protein